MLTFHGLVHVLGSSTVASYRIVSASTRVIRSVSRKSWLVRWVFPLRVSPALPLKLVVSMTRVAPSRVRANRPCIAGSSSRVRTPVEPDAARLVDHLVPDHHVAGNLEDLGAHVVARRHHRRQHTARDAAVVGAEIFEVVERMRDDLVRKIVIVGAARQRHALLAFRCPRRKASVGAWLLSCVRSTSNVQGLVRSARIGRMRFT
jgi:hypothetical protein